MTEEVVADQAAAEVAVVEEAVVVVADAEAVADNKTNHYEKNHHSFTANSDKPYMAYGGPSDI